MEMQPIGRERIADDRDDWAVTHFLISNRALNKDYYVDHSLAAQR